MGAVSNNLKMSAGLNSLVGGNAAALQGIGNATGGPLKEMGQKLGQKGPLSGMIGQGGGVGGSGISGPQQAQLQQGTSTQDVMNSQTGATNTMAAQNALLAALGAQNGLGQQNMVAQQQQALANQLAGANGVATQQGAIQGLQNTAGMYGNIAAGVGPNPAQAAMNNMTGQNIAAQSALMAGQRGAGANVGLLARQAAMQGANTQQQAIGQNAQLQAQQQLNALAGLGSTQQAIGGMGGSQIAAQQAAQNAMAGQANTIANQQIGVQNQSVQNALANQSQMQGALQGVNQNAIASQGSVNSANAGLAQTQLGGQQKVVGGLLSGLGAAVGMADGGEVPATPPAGAASSFGRYLTGYASGGLAESGGHVTAMNSSQKAVKPGDSPSNDKIPAKLSAGEIVIPRSVAMSADPVKGSADFVQKVLAKRKVK